jgi:uncharacterized protein (TIGR03663 family)
VEPAGPVAWLKSRLTFERIFFIVFLLAIILRFAFLDLKLFHHDEAIHSWFCYDFLTRGGYVYDPQYHGPLLYFLTTGMFALFGDSDLVARILPALFGTLLIPLVYVIYRLGYLDKRQAVVAALFLAVSPEMVYFSRFLRHDIFQLFFTLLIVVGLLLYHRTGRFRYAILTGIAVGGGMTLKEDMPILLLIFFAFGCYLLASRKIQLPPTWKRDTAAALLLALGIILVFYTSFGAHPEVVVPLGNSTLNQTGWYKAVDHWVAMSNICRICGPWFFYLLLFLLYEAPIFLLALFAIGQFLAGDRKLRDWVGSVWKALQGRTPPPPNPIGDLARTSLAQLRGWEGPDHRQRDFFVFSLFWFVCTVAAYAYIGEKVPWLSIHQVLPMCFVAVYRMTPRKTIIAVASCAFLILMAWHVAFVPADVNEPIVQVQNSEDLRVVFPAIDASEKVVIASKDYWPLPWYYRGHRWDKIHFYGNRINNATLDSVNPDLVITHDLESYDSLDGYNKRTYKLAYWFSYYDAENRLPEYYFLRDGKMGSINIDLFTKQGSAADAALAARNVT